MTAGGVASPESSCAGARPLPARARNRSSRSLEAAEAGPAAASAATRPAITATVRVGLTTRIVQWTSVTRIVDRYVLKELAAPFALGVGVFTFFLVIDRIYSLTDLVITKGVP